MAEISNKSFKISDVKTFQLKIMNGIYDIEDPSGASGRK